jgi:hypothetical protein
MTPINFAYWLQGYFELSDEIVEGVSLPLKVRVLISQHIDMCKATPGNYNSKLVGFLGWMESAIEFTATSDSIRKKLDNLFEHVIDPMTVDDEVAQNQSAAHNPYNYPDGARC